MIIPNLAAPVFRSLETTRGDDLSGSASSAALRSGQGIAPAEIETCGIDQCYFLPGLAQQLCLMAA